MNGPVLTDLKGVDFTEGDRVVYSSVNGIRVGVVDWIRESINHYSKQPVYKVFILLTEHTELDAKVPGKMFKAKIGYDYHPAHFLKVPHLTDSSD